MTKTGNAWALATLEDLEGAIEVLFFPAAYQLCGIHLAEDAVVLVRGRLDKREEMPRIIAMDVSVPDVSEGRAVRCHHPARAALHAAGRRAAARRCSRTHPGTTEVRLQLQAGGEADGRCGSTTGCASTRPTALMADLKALLGPGAIAS